MKRTFFTSLLLMGVMVFVASIDAQAALHHKEAPKAKASMRHKAPAADGQLTSSSFGFLDGTDGMTWHYTQQYEGDMYSYTKSTVTVYNAQRELQGQFTVDVPADMRVNMIEPFGLVTTKLFDRNSSTKEVLVYLHQVGNEANNYKSTDHLYVYNLNGEKVAEFLGDGMIVDASPNEWTTWQRLVLSHDNADKKHVDVDFYRSPSWGDDSAVLEKTLQLDMDKITYTDGAFVNFVKVNGEPHFVLCHYEKSFVEYDEDGNQVMNWETFMPVFTEDNKFIIDTYNKNFEKVSSFGIPTNTNSDKYIVRMNAFGTLSDNDLTRGFYTGDNKLNYVVMNEDVKMDTEYVLSFDVYDEDGNFVRTLADNVGDNYKKMTDIKGMEEQWLFLNAEGDGLFTVDLPSCERKELPSKVDGYSISFNIDRVPAKNEEGVQYVMGVNEAKTDATGKNVIAMFAYLNPDFTADHYVDINMGPLAQTFTPLVNAEGLDPYLFNTDDQREFLFFSKVKDNEGTTDGHNVLFLTNEEGKIVETWNLEAGNTKGDIWSAMVMNYGSTRPSLLVNFYDWDNDINHLEFFDLPLVKFAAGGDGTEENPYLISSAGDLAQIVGNKEAFYRVACDFDAFGHPVAIEEFNGQLDGNGKTIYNLDVTSDNYYGGLFGSTTGAKIHDLTLSAPSATVTGKNEQFGLISGFAIETSINNVCVKHGNIESAEMTATPVGVIVGMATGETKIEDCYVRDTKFNTVNRSVGGVVGEMRTSSEVTRCAVNGSELTANGEIGGIAGIIGNGCKVSDSSVSETTIKGNNYVGGVSGRCGVSSSRGNIERCIVSATIECPMLTDNMADINTYAVGGLTGCIEPDWQKEGLGNISGNVLYECELVTSNGDYLFAPYLRIAGSTIGDEDDTRKEACLSNNFQKTLFEGEVAFEDYQDATSVYGKMLTSDVPALDFWTGLGYVFGTTSEEPWVYQTGYRPYLFFERNADMTGIEAITTDKAQTNAGKGIYTIEGVRVNSISKPGLYIVNGKKVILK